MPPRSTRPFGRHLRHAYDFLTAPPPAGRTQTRRSWESVPASRSETRGIFFGGLANKMSYGYSVTKKIKYPRPRHGGSEPQPSAESSALAGETLRLPHISGRWRLRRSLSTSRLRASWNPLTTRSLTRFPKGPPPGAFGRDAAPARRATAAPRFLDGSRERPRFSISLFDRRVGAIRGAVARRG